jgi:hypothetical protein
MVVLLRDGICDNSGVRGQSVAITDSHQILTAALNERCRAELYVGHGVANRQT